MKAVKACNQVSVPCASQEILVKTAGVGDDMSAGDVLAAERGDKSAMMRGGVYTARTLRPLDGERPKTPPVANLGPYTPEVNATFTYNLKKLSIKNHVDFNKSIMVMYENTSVIQ